MRSSLTLRLRAGNYGAVRVGDRFGIAPYLVPDMRIHPPRHPATVSIRLAVRAAVGLAVTLAAACGTPDGRSAGDDAAAGIDTVASAAPRAAYLTSLTFVGFEPSPSLVHFRFENLADRNRLALSYQGWIAGREDWTPILQVEDSIPVIRGAWRVMPVGGLRLRVGSGAQIEGLRVPVEGEPLRLEALDAISSWSSSTGQRETLRSAELLLGPGAESGLLLQRRRARPLETGRPSAPSQALVLTDTIGDGIIILRNRAVPDAPATVWAWLDGERLEWSDALLISLSAPEGSPGRWSLEVAREGIVVEIQGAAPVLETATGMGSAYRLYPVRATLSIGDERRQLGGMGIEDDGP